MAGVSGRGADAVLRPAPSHVSSTHAPAQNLRAKPLIQLSEHDWWTVGNAIEGTQVFGATGSGKTSGSGRTIARAFLEAGFGGLVLTSKPKDVEDWEKLLHRSKRSSDAIYVRAGGDRRLDFLEYEFRRPGRGAGLTQNVVSLITNAIGSTGDGGAGEDPYWTDALRHLVTNAVDLVALARGSVSLPDVSDVIRDAPQDRREIATRAWRDRSRCFELLREAESRVTDGDRRGDLASTTDYWLSEFPALSDRTRSIVVSMFSAKVAGLLRSPLRQLFCSGSTVTPEDSHEGKVIILDLSVKEYGEVGRLAQILFKTCWQRSTERRHVGPDSRPVFLWADESQYFVTPEDTLFQQTARSALAATVYITQNMPNYFTAMGGRRGRDAAESFVGNLQTKIFHANGDPTTNEWAERIIGRDWLTRRSRTMTGKGEISFGTSDQHSAIIGSSEFTGLRKGGPPDFLVEAIVFEAGRTWRGTSENHLRTAFQQGD